MKPGVGLGRATYRMASEPHALAPMSTSAARKRAMAAMQRGDWEAALAAYGEVLAIDPDDCDALMMSGIARGQTGDLAEAARLLERVAVLAPALPAVHINISKLALETGDCKRAEDAARQALALSPDLPLAIENLVVALKRQGRWEDADAEIKNGLARCPGASNLLMLLGEFRQRTGDIAAAIDAFRQAEPSPANLSSLVAAHNYAEIGLTSEIFAVHRAWGRRFEPSLASVLPPPPAPREGRLKIGYLSPDLRDHSVAFFIEPVLQAHSAAVEVYCYSTAPRPDVVTTRLRALVAHWRDVASLSEQALARQIREDGVDVLVDLAGHTLNNRLTLFAMRVAPVQATWIGYPNTTGLAAMDFRLTDAICDPPGEDAVHSERLVRLPHGFLCYRPPVEAPRPQSPPTGSPSQASTPFRKSAPASLQPGPPSYSGCRVHGFDLRRRIWEIRSPSAACYKSSQPKGSDRSNSTSYPCSQHAVITSPPIISPILRSTPFPTTARQRHVKRYGWAFRCSPYAGRRTPGGWARVSTPRRLRRAHRRQ